MRTRRLYYVLLGLLWFPAYVCSVEPTPTCNPQNVEVTLDQPADVTPTYVPGTSITLTLRPVVLEDWPTTPTHFYWNSSWGGRFDGGETEVFVFPDPGEVEVWFSAAAQGPGARADCQGWATVVVGSYFFARLFDAGTPTPEPTPTPTFVFIPWYGTCRDLVISPPYDGVDLPSSVIIEHGGVAFLALETIDGSQSFPVKELGNNRYLAENLPPRVEFIWYYIPGLDTCGEPSGLCWSWFTTGDYTVETPTPSPAPSPTLSPVPTATLSPVPTATPSPVPTQTDAPTPTPIPTSMGSGTGWIVSQAQGNEK